MTDGKTARDPTRQRAAPARFPRVAGPALSGSGVVLGPRVVPAGSGAQPARPVRV